MRDDFSALERRTYTEQLRQLFIDYGDRRSDYLALKRASREDRFELIALSDHDGKPSEAALALIEAWDLYVPVAWAGADPGDISIYEDEEAFSSYALTSEVPERLLRLACRDAGGLDVMLLGDPNALIEAVDADTQIEENLDLLVLNLGELAEYGDNGFKTASSLRFPDEWNRVFALGKQRFVLDPRMLERIRLPEETVSELEAAAEALPGRSARVAIDSLLALYMYVEPQAFIFEGCHIHMHNHGEQRGWFFLEDGDDVLLATQVNVDRFNAWILEGLK